MKKKGIGRYTFIKKMNKGNERNEKNKCANPMDGEKIYILIFTCFLIYVKIIFLPFSVAKITN